MKGENRGNREQSFTNIMCRFVSVLLTSTGDVVSRCKEYSKDLFNPINTSFTEEVESPGSPIARVEVTDVVKKLQGRALGVDDIHPKFLKTLDVVGRYPTSLGHQGQYLWTGRLAWWFWWKQWTGGCLPISLLSVPGKVYAGGAGEESPVGCQTSGSGGTMLIPSWSWNTGPALKENIKIPFSDSVL